jgi:hypothetical protein
VRSRISPKNARICRMPTVVMAAPHNLSGVNIAHPRYTSNTSATMPEMM